MNRLDAPSTAPQTPLEAPSGPSPLAPTDSDQRTRTESSDSFDVRVEVQEPSVVTFHVEKAAKKNLRTRPVILTYPEYAALEGINRDTISYRVTHGGLIRVDTGRRSCRGHIVYGIPLDQPGVSASAQARYWAEQRQLLDSTRSALDSTPAHHGAAPTTRYALLSGNSHATPEGSVVPTEAPTRDGQAPPLRLPALAPHHEEHVSAPLVGGASVPRIPVGGASLPRVPAAREAAASGGHLSGPLPPAGPCGGAGVPPARQSAGRMPAPRAHAAARLNDEGIPVLASDPRLVWEAGLLATRGQHICEEFFRRRRIVLAVEAAMAAVPHKQKDMARRQAIALLRRQPDCADLTLGTVRRWQGHYRQEGEQRLVPRWAKEEGSKTIPKRLQALLEAFYAQGGRHDELDRPTIAQCHRQLLTWWLAFYSHLAEPPAPPSIWAVQRFICHILDRRPGLIEGARHGKDTFRDAHGFHVRRDPQAMPLGHCFCLDHRIMDTHVIAPSGRIVRPWFTAMIDIHSADFVGWVLRERVSSDGVASAFRRAILGWGILDEPTGELIQFPPHGVPAHAYLDHGKEFHGGAMKDTVGGASVPRVLARGGRFSKAFSHSPKDLALDQAVSETLFSGLGIHRVTAIRYSARSKPIEPIFNSFATRVENLIAGHCGRNTLDKPEQLKERAKRGELLGWTQYLVVLARALDQWRREAPIGDGRDKPPAEYWDDWQGELPDPDRLDTLLLRKEAKRIQGNGIQIEHGRDKFHYMIDDAEFAMLSGALVDVLWTQDDTEFCIAILPTSGRRLVCPRVDLRAKSWDLMLGREMPAEHRLVKRAAGEQQVRLLAYQRWGRDMRSAASADPTGSLTIAAGNGAEIRGIRREIVREGQAGQPRAAAPEPPPSDVDFPASVNALRGFYRSLGRAAADRQAALDALDPQLEPAREHHAEPGGQGAAGLRALDGDDLPRAACAGDLDVHAAQRPGAHDHHAQPRPHLGDLLGVHHAAQRLGERRRAAREPLGHLQDVSHANGVGGDGDQLGERPLVGGAHALRVRAQVLQPVPAQVAGAAGHRRRHRHAIPHPEVAGRAIDLGHGRNEFVAEDRAWGEAGVLCEEELVVGAADAAALDAAQQPAELGPRVWHVPQVEAPRPAVDDRLHPHPPNGVSRLPSATGS